MPMTVDTILERMQLKKRVAFWRNIAFAIIGLFVLALVNKSQDMIGVGEDYIARIEIEGLILEDADRIKALRQLRDDDRVKAVILAINSPGGTIVGGESLYKIIKEIAKEKPVAASMGGVATSGGYMVAIAADRIYAYEGTITGSIGVLLQAAEITELADKIGVNLLTFKTSELKGAPSPFEKVTPAVKDYIQNSLAEAEKVFVNIVAEAREMPIEKVTPLANGGIYLGNEAVTLGLIDAIGDEEDAIEWLKSERNIASDLKIRAYPLKKEEAGFSKLFSLYQGKQNYLTQLFENGLMAVWRPGI